MYYITETGKIFARSSNKNYCKNVLFELSRVTKQIFPFADLDYPDLHLKTPKKK